MAKKIKSYTETELIDMFGLTRLSGNDAHALMARWTNTHTTFDDTETALFEEIFANAKKNIIGWREEDLKMHFISPVLFLGQLKNTDRYLGFYERTLEDTIDGFFLKNKTDFMIASGSLGIFKTPYFHFQEYKPFKNPTGDSMGQLLESFLIAQKQNNNQKPIYGCEVAGRTWSFVVMQDRTYCVSDIYDSTNKQELQEIIAILRHFKLILETELL